MNDHPTIVLDNSQIELITTCPTKANYAINMRRRSSAPAPAQRLGAHIHSALALRYEREALGQPWTEADQFKLLESAFASDPCEAEGWRTLSMAQKVIHHYNEHYDLEKLDIQMIKDVAENRLVPLVEKPFAYTLGEIAGYVVVWTGRIDLCIARNGRVFVLDFKTTSRLGDSFWQDAAVMQGQRGYCHAVRECLGIDITGYIIRALAIREPTKTGTSVEFHEEVYYIAHPPGQLDDWKSNVLAEVETWLWYNARGVFPRHHAQHCVGKWGTCEFYNVCTRPESSRAAELASDAFTENTWKPTV